MAKLRISAAWYSFIIKSQTQVAPGGPAPGGTENVRNGPPGASGEWGAQEKSEGRTPRSERGPKAKIRSRGTIRKAQRHSYSKVRAICLHRRSASLVDSQFAIFNSQFSMNLTSFSSVPSLLFTTSSPSHPSNRSKAWSASAEVRGVCARKAKLRRDTCSSYATRSPASSL